MAAILEKSILRFFCTERPINKNLVGSTGATCRSKRAKIVLIGHPGWPPFWKSRASPPDPKCQLTQNLIGNIEVTCRSKIAKIVLIRNPRPSQQPSCKSVLNFLIKSQLTPNLVGSIGATCRSKIAKVVPIRNQRWLHGFFSWMERTTD